MDNFNKSLKNAKRTEQLVMDYLRPSVKHIREIGKDLTGVKRRNLERVAGDIRLLTNKNEIIRIEVKRDASAYRTGNLFLERYSDNGERSGKTTVGWFNNEDAKYTHYAFVLLNKGTVIVSRQELKELVKRVRPRVVSMKYDMDQWNRSDGYLVKINQVLNECKSSKLIKDLYI